MGTWETRIRIKASLVEVPFLFIEKGIGKMNSLHEANSIMMKVNEKFEKEINPKIEKMSYGPAFLREAKRARNLANRNARKLKRMVFSGSDQEHVDLYIEYLETLGKGFDHLCRRETSEAKRLEAKVVRLFSEIARKEVNE